MSTYVNVDVALPHLAQDIMRLGSEVGSRLGERTLEVLHPQIVLTQPWQREVLVPQRGANIAAQIAETMWVLAGRNDIGFIERYLPRAADFSDDGATWRGGYGPRLRKWQPLGASIHFRRPGGVLKNADIDGPPPRDQIRHVFDVLSKDPTSRRAVAAIYDPSVDMEPGKDIPCNDFLSFISREGYLSLAVTVRSNDLIWGWSGINQFEWSALQEILATHLGLKVGTLVFNTTSLHIYDRHWKKARALQVEPMMRAFQDSPRYEPSDLSFDYFETLLDYWFDYESKIRQGKALDIDRFPEPMFRSWLRVIAWYWSGDEKYLTPLEGTRLWAAVQQAPASIQMQVAGRAIKIAPEEPVIATLPEAFQAAPHGQGFLVQGRIKVGSPVTVYPVTLGTTGVDEPLAYKEHFVQYVDSLHREKSAAYGDSWKRRGEQRSILANIARKVDRLGTGGTTGDETSADTAIDLLVYLIKYRLWLTEQYSVLRGGPYFAGEEYEDRDENGRVGLALGWLKTVLPPDPAFLVAEALVEALQKHFDDLEIVVDADPNRTNPKVRADLVDLMVSKSFRLARHLWEQEYRRNREIIAEREAGATSGYVNQDGAEPCHRTYRHEAHATATGRCDGRV